MAADVLVDHPMKSHRLFLDRTYFFFVADDPFRYEAALRATRDAGMDLLIVTDASLSPELKKRLSIAIRIINKKTDRERRKK